jgi:hypothetical protein
LNLSPLDLNGSTLDLDTPRLLDVGFGWAVERFNKGESEFRPLSRGEFSRLFLEVGKLV